MPLVIPKKRCCPGQATKYPISNYDPFLWLKGPHGEFCAFSIGGFVINQGLADKVSGIFLKFESVSADRIPFGELLTVLSPLELDATLKLSEVLNCGCDVFIWPKDYPTGYDPNKSLIARFQKEDLLQRRDSTQLISTQELAALIRKLRGRSFPMPKPLISASSNLECFLANNTQDPWPGDIDCLISDKTSGIVTSIIEFKTHNIGSPVKEEHIGKYGAQDWRRFNVLFDLQEALNRKQGLKPKLIFVVWGTGNMANHAELKIDEIERGKVLKTLYIKRPNFDEFSNELFQIVTQ